MLHSLDVIPVCLPPSGSFENFFDRGSASVLFVFVQARHLWKDLESFKIKTKRSLSSAATTYSNLDRPAAATRTRIVHQVQRHRLRESPGIRTRQPGCCFTPHKSPDQIKVYRSCDQNSGDLSRCFLWACFEQPKTIQCWLSWRAGRPTMVCWSRVTTGWT